VYLSLDDNYFTGSIPPSNGNLKGLSTLNFTRNGLSGSIPQELSKIYGLQKLYLAHNNLSGAIPQLLQNSSALVELDLSYNHLDGEVPSHGVFANITRFSVIGNDGLCGGVAELKLPPCEVKPHSSHRKRLQLKIFLPTFRHRYMFISSISCALSIQREKRIGQDQCYTKLFVRQVP
jgi:Leucine-rich repeat (LRR) protein